MLIEDGGIIYEEGMLDDLDNIKMTPVYLPYSHWRVKEVMLSWGIEVRTLYGGYKANRYRTCLKYQLINMYTNEIIGDEYGYTLYFLRCFLAKNKVPLHGEAKKKPSYKSSDKPSKRRQACVDFLEIVDNISNPSID